MVPMFLTVLGCSGSIGGPTSPASGYLVEVEGMAPVVIDMGPGVLGALQRHAVPEHATILLSHLHADHCLDVPSLLVLRRFGPRSTGLAKVPLVGPSGTAYRIGVASAEVPGAVDDLSDTFEVSTWDVAPELDLRDDDEVVLHVRAGRVNHPPESYGLRLTSTDSCTAVIPRIARSSSSSRTAPTSCCVRRRGRTRVSTRRGSTCRAWRRAGSLAGPGWGV